MEEVARNTDIEKPIFPKSFGPIQAVGNIAIGVSEMAFSFNFSRIKDILDNFLTNPSALADALHNIFADTTFLRHGKEIHNVFDEEILARRRKLTYAAIFTGATAIVAASVAKAGFDISQTVDGKQIEDNLSIGAVAATAGSFVFSSLRYVKPRIAAKKRLDSGGVITASEQDALDHLKKYDIPSALLALSGTLFQKYVHLPFNLNTEANDVLGAYGGWLGMKHFVPTTSNLEKHNHDHADHDHSDHAH